jgi:hypothetical protein
MMVIALLVVTLLVSLGSAAAQSPSCGGIYAIPGPMGYQRRANADRCEGFYQQQVAGGLEFLSMVNGTINYNLGADKVLFVVVPQLNQRQAPPIFLSGRSLRPGTYYRMDATVHSAETFKWPLGPVIAPAGLGPDSIGLVAWIQEDIDKYYVPISVFPENTVAPPKRPPTMILRSSLDIEVLKWRWRPEGGDWLNHLVLGGNDASTIRAGQLVKLDLNDRISGSIVVEIVPKYVNQDRAQPQQFRIIMP